MIPDAEYISVHELLDYLKMVKLAKKHQVKVVRARVVFEAHGALPTRVVIGLREIYKTHHVAIKKVYESRERARVSMAREKLREQGVTGDDLASRRERRISGLRERVEDLGF